MIEPIEALRARLLSSEDVLKAIQMRAYEIWLLRGRQHGRDHEDWMLAENEIINYLIERELRSQSQQPVAEEPITAPLFSNDEVIEIVEVEVVATPVDISPEPIPEADVFAETAAPVEEPEAKIPGKRAANKTTTTTRKPRAVKEGAEKKTAAKKSSAVKKTTTRKTASKKSAKPDQPVVK
jgi:hypothetical protein